MTTTKKALYALTILFFSVVILFTVKEKNEISAKESNPYYVETFKTADGGWGYAVYKREKLIIKQDIIPTIQKSISFQSENDAKKTGMLVVDKLKNNQLPSVRPEELEQLNIVPTK
jgi:hypothetical protein